MVVSTTPRMVAVFHTMTPHAPPDYSSYWFVSDEPALAALHHHIWGWDLVALIGFIRRQIDVAAFNLRDGEAREWLDSLSTVSAPSRTAGRQEKRPAGQTMELIRSFVVDHPDCNRLMIAQGVERKKTPHLIAQIECLVAIGQLARTHIIRPGGVIEYRYVFAGDDAN